jgi:hypothetical protein
MEVIEKTKWCSKCRKHKSTEAFSWANKARGVLQGYCKPCKSLEFKAYYAANITKEKKREYARNSKPENRAARNEYWRQRKLAEPEKTFTRKRTSYLKTQYGITPEIYDAMLAAQFGCCAICGSESPGRGGKYFHVDHCHTTQAVRGLLCNACNIGLGYFRDDATVMASALTYLKGPVR